MARLHTKKHGKAKSRKPMPENSEESQIKGADIEKLIVDYSKQGMKPAMIGETLKREHNVKYLKKAPLQMLPHTPSSPSSCLSALCAPCAP